jgi:hypothetical protein
VDGDVPTTYIVTACVSDKRWFDLDAERTPTDRYDLGGNGGREHAGGRSGGDMRGGPHNSGSNPAGAPPLDCWVDDTAETVARRLINLMCPREVCTVCGEPRRRIVGEPEYVTANGDTSDDDAEWRHGRGGDVHGLGSTAPQSLTRHAPTLGWTDCGHDNYRRGVVLDPFAGSGTTGVAASESGRDSILIDIDERNLELARQRIGLFLEEVS